MSVTANQVVVKKILTLSFIISLTPLIGGVYGILHDQLTYTVSPEYYTKFKFYQFGLLAQGDETVFPNPRFQVAIVGFMATWWMGLPIGLILGLVGLSYKSSQQVFWVTMRSILVTIVVAFATGILGLGYGKFYLSNRGVNWWLPDNLVDTESFIAVGSMHNFSYLGGLIGVFAGVAYSLKTKRRDCGGFKPASTKKH